MREVSFPIFLRCKDDKRVKRYGSIDELHHHLEPIDVEEQEYEGWDAHGFRVLLRIQDPKSRRWLEVESSGQGSFKEEVLQAFAEFAAAEGASFAVPTNSEDLVQAYETLQRAVQLVWDRKPWIKRFLERF